MQDHSNENSKSMDECARNCHECLDACLKTIAHCLGRGGEHASREHQTLLTDCAAICAVSHGFLHRQSSQHQHTCRACAEICRACAEHCEKMGKGDDVMMECAQACKRCAESCERMSAAHV